MVFELVTAVTCPSVTVAVAVSVLRLPPYSIFLTTSIRVMVAQFRKFPLHRLPPQVYRLSPVSVAMLLGTNTPES